MQEAAKFPRSSRTSDSRELPKDALNQEPRERETPEIKITLERPESIELLKSTRPAAQRTSDDDPVPRPLAAREIGATPSPDVAPATAEAFNTREGIPSSVDVSISDARAGVVERPDEAPLVTSSSDSTSVKEPFKTADFLRTFVLIVATIGSLLVAGWSYSLMLDMRGQLALATGAKESADKALAESQSRLAATEKVLAESQSRLTIAEKAVAGVKAALTPATASSSTEVTPGMTAK
jgi:hypothetical protein